MFRMMIAFLMSPVMQSAYGEDLFSADVDGIKQAAIDAALIEHPELLPGDLEDDNSASVLIVCSTSNDSVHQCSAHVQFKILSTTKEDILREGDTCYESTESKNVSVVVLPDGSVLRVNSSGYGISRKSIDCPADIDEMVVVPE